MRRFKVFQKFHGKMGRIAAAVGTMSLVAASQAMAVLPTEADTAVTEVSTFVTDIKAAAWPIATSVTVGLVGIGLFKKFVSRAS